MHIGLIGGIGPASTVVYYQRLSKRMHSLRVPPNVTLVNVDLYRVIEHVNDDR